MTDPIATVRTFIDAWPRLDAGELCGFFTDDIVYHNIPLPPLTGLAMVHEAITVFLQDWTGTNWDVLNIAAAGDVVFTERVDHIRIGAKAVSLPVCGVFVVRDGKISAWRDYFDLATYTNAISG